VLIIILGVAMGLQNATARGLGVPDLTTTVLTMTLTGMGADSRIAGGRDGRIGRRLLSVLAMFAGGLAGVLLIESGQGRWVLVFATLLLGGVTLWVARARRATTGWVQKPA